MSASGLLENYENNVSTILVTLSKSLTHDLISVFTYISRPGKVKSIFLFQYLRLFMFLTESFCKLSKQESTN